MSQPQRLSDLTAGAGPSFDQPFDMLAACHDRLLRMLALLQRLQPHLRQHGADAQARQAAGDVVRYFDEAAPRHHRDEELHIFPPLLARGDPLEAEMIGRLLQDHRAMETGWTTARGVLVAVADGTLHALTPAHEAALQGFAVLHADHLQAEDTLAYPAARALLDAPTLAAMGAEMAARRRPAAPDGKG